MMSAQVTSEKLKRPLQALLISPVEEVREGILLGKITMTIREGWRDYQHGLVMLGCQIEPFVVMAEISDVKFVEWRDISDACATASGFKDKECLEGYLRRFYKNMDDDTKFTLISFGNLSGKIVDEFKETARLIRWEPLTQLPPYG